MPINIKGCTVLKGYGGLVLMDLDKEKFVTMADVERRLLNVSRPTAGFFYH